MSNCRLLAERITKFQIEDLKSAITKNINDMKEFFETTYKGFYCSLCDYDNHKFFDIEN